MSKTVTFQDLGSADYKKTWEYQEELFNKILEEKLASPTGK